MTAKHDDILARIEDFNAVEGCGVVIQQASKGYSLFREDTGSPSRDCVPLGKATGPRSCGGRATTRGTRCETSVPRRTCMARGESAARNESVSCRTQR